MARSPMFLQRRSYRARRMMDAVRFLPVVGLVLWMVPLLWPVAGGVDEVSAMLLSAALQYIFGIWMLLVLAAWALWRRPNVQTEGDVTPDTSGSDAG